MRARIGSRERADELEGRRHGEAPEPHRRFGERNHGDGEPPGLEEAVESVIQITTEDTSAEREARDDEHLDPPLTGAGNGKARFTPIFQGEATMTSGSGWVLSFAVTVLLGASGSFGQERAALSEEASLIAILEGEWRFELFLGDAKEPTATGKRTFRRLIEDHSSLSWFEEFDGRDVVVSGVLGYDVEKRRFYELGIPSVGAVDFWIGTLGPDGASIDWIDPLATERASRGQLRVSNRRELVYSNDSFRAVFTRLE